MPDFTTQLSAFEAMYSRIFAILDDYPEPLRERSGACGVWSPKQLVAHFSGWLVEAGSRFDAYRNGTAQPISYDGRFDEYNARAVDSRAHLDWEATIQDLQACYADFMDKLAHTPEEEKQTKARYGGWLDALHEDCAQHYEQLHQFKEGQTI